MPDRVLRQLADATAAQVRDFLEAVTQVAAGSEPGAALPLLLLATSDVMSTGARLAATVDVVPPTRFEPDPGPNPDLDPLRGGLANSLHGLDAYADVADPLYGLEAEEASITNDLMTVVEALSQGLGHYDAGRAIEALWWWQYSFFAQWGERAAALVRVLHAVLAHLRLDVDDDVAQEAEFEALHTPG